MAKQLKRNGSENQYASSMNFEIKQFDEPEDRILRFIGSDETPDRDGDVISVNGWDLNNYKMNPVFLWAHDYSIPPLGKANSVQVEKGKLMFDIEFPEKGIYPLADLVYNLYKGGFLNATSVGFVGKEATQRDDEASKELPEWRRGVKFLAQELLELSAVPVPSNPAALHQAKSAGALSDDEYSSLMSFISGEFVVNSSAGVKTMKGIQTVYETHQKTIEQEEEREMKKENEDKKTEETKEPNNTSGSYGFLLDPSKGKTLLVDNDSGKILGDMTEEVKSLISQALKAAKAAPQVELKAGAVLSKQNKGRLSQAKDLIIEVLGQSESGEGTNEEQAGEEEKGSGAPLENENERTNDEDISMANGTKSPGTAEPDEADKGKEEVDAKKGEDNVVLELDDSDEKSIEIDVEDADTITQLIKSAVAASL